MLFKKKNNFIYIYIYSLVLITFLTNFSTTNAFSKIYKVEDISVNEPYDLSFDKNSVIEKAFVYAFNKLLNKITLSKDISNFKNVKNLKVKELVDSFIIVDEKFADNNYFAKFEVEFDKDKVLKFLDKKNVFSAIPQSKKIFILPILINIEENKILMFSENIFYKEWEKNKKSYFLIDYILPNEDLEDIGIIQNKIETIENYEFSEIVKKYNLEDYIILLVFKNDKNLRVLSKMNLNNNKKIITNLYNASLKDSKEVSATILNLKTSYEDEWKKQNIINTSIKLTLKTSLNSKSIETLNKFENKLFNSDFVYEFNIERFTNDNTIYKIVYNNTPDKFLSEFKSYGFHVDTSNSIWEIK